MRKVYIILPVLYLYYAYIYNDMSINLTFIYIVGQIDILMESMKYITLIIPSHRVN